MFYAAWLSPCHGQLFRCYSEVINRFVMTLKRLSDFEKQWFMQRVSCSTHSTKCVAHVTGSFPAKSDFRTHQLLPGSALQRLQSVGRLSIKLRKPLLYRVKNWWLFVLRRRRYPKSKIDQSFWSTRYYMRPYWESQIGLRNGRTHWIQHSFDVPGPKEF
jgi:hypothetical protein